MERWRTAMVVIISGLFVLLYVGALFNWSWLAPEPNKEVLGYLQPVVWVIIGYYFGKVPSERSELAAKDAKKDAAEARVKVAKTQERLTRSEVAAQKAHARIIAARQVLKADVRRKGLDPTALIRSIPLAATFNKMSVEAHTLDVAATPKAPVELGVTENSSAAAAALRILEDERSEDCDVCVQTIIQDWAGSEVTGMGDVLSDLYLAVHGPCDNGALRDLLDLLRARCGADISLSDLKCSMTVGNVVQVVCGA